MFLAQRINISESTKQELDRLGGFDIEPRGEIVIKVKTLYTLIKVKTVDMFLSHVNNQICLNDEKLTIVLAYPKRWDCRKSI